MASTLVLLGAVISLSIIYIIRLIVKRMKFLSDLSWIPGPSALPFLGNYYELVALPRWEAFENMTKFYKKYGKVYKVWIGSTPVIHCQDLDMIQVIFKQEEKTCRPQMYKLIRQFLGPGLLFGEAGEDWKVHRRHLTESFHGNVLEESTDVTVKKIKSLIEYLEVTSQDGKAVNLAQISKRAFLDTITNAVAGVDTMSMEKQESYQYVEAIDRMAEMVMVKLFSPGIMMGFMFNQSSEKKAEERTKKIISQLNSSIITDRIKENKEMSRYINPNSEMDKKRKILLDNMLIKEEQLFPMPSIESNLSNHIFAGYDTQSMATAFLLFALGNHLDIQNELVKEINAIAPDVLEKGIGMKELSQLQLLDRCLKETLRIFPSPPMIGRKLLEPIETNKGTLPAGVEVYFNLYNYHRDKEVFPEPEKFDPDRFLPEAVSKRHPNSFIPFGLGVRTCIGQKLAILQIKLATTMILKKFHVRSYEPISNLKLMASLVLQSKNGIRVYLTPRT